MARAALGTFASGKDASLWLVFNGTTTSSPLGQVKSFSWTVAKTTEDQRRVGDSKLYRKPTGLEVSMSLHLWHDNKTNSELKAFRTRGNAMTAGTASLIAQEYSGEGTDSTLVATYTFANFDVTNYTDGPREGGSMSYTEFEMVADSVVES